MVLAAAKTWNDSETLCSVTPVSCMSVHWTGAAGACVCMGLMMRITVRRIAASGDCAVCSARFVVDVVMVDGVLGKG
jgi:hypothetical protein